MTPWPLLAFIVLAHFIPDSGYSATDRVYPGGVAGTVTTNGAAVEGAAVVPLSLDTPSAAIPEKNARTDRDGRYSWPLPAGNYEISVWSDGYRQAVQRIEVVTDEFVTLDFVLSRHRDFAL